jgi:hypothetical protein
MAVPTKALSIRQPWAWAILDAGKDVENRNWQPNNPNLRFRGEFFIHAAQGMTVREYSDFADFYQLQIDPKAFPPSRAVLPRGGIVGIAEIADIVTDHASPWFFGRVGLVLRNVRRTNFVLMKGALGFFNVPSVIAAKAMR